MEVETGRELAPRPGDEIVVTRDRPWPVPPTLDPGRTDVLGMLQDRSTWIDGDPITRLNLLRAWVMGTVPRGDLYAAIVTDPPVERLVNDAQEFVPLPDCYVKLGVCDHRPDSMGRFMAKPAVDDPGATVTISSYQGGAYPYGRLLVLSRIDDVAGVIWFGSYIPRVRIGDFSCNGELEVFAYPDQKAGFTVKMLMAGPGWVKALDATGYQDPS